MTGRARPSRRELGGDQVEGRQAVRELLVAGRRKVYELWVASDDERGPVRDIVDLAARGRVTVKHVSAGKLAGFIVGREVANEEDWEIENMVVAESERRQGFASALVADLLKRARGKNTCRFWLEVRAGNAAAIGLYRRFAFEEESRRKNYYSHPTEDALVLALKLREQTLEELQE